MRGWTGGGGGGGTGIRGAGDWGKGGGGGGKGAGDGGREGGGRRKRGGGSEIFWGGGYTKICCILPILLYFYVLKCNNWVSGISNRRIKVNLGIFTMNPTLISLHRRGVFRQPRFTLNSFTSDFGFSLVDYFPFDSESSQNSHCRWQSTSLEIIIRLP